ncbi:glycosyltransferase family 4 protein [Dyella sp.]|uniref:glycosyltransferase family 4 protein n=1 Tax=Dyella sp. TaxID=1869338 RepID=UPI002B469316|nr:glycosyltransferase family 4 protein [Dyella sp.]HKT29809.1 glycosyltransferase family 4 protein [Dyella sp.]
MHVAQINFLSPPKELAAADVFAHWPSLADIPDAAASSGIKVSVIQAAARRERVVRNEVDYHFLDIGQAKTLIDRGYQFASQLDQLKADVLHVHGLSFGEDAFAISHYLPRLPVLFQDHADRPPRWWRRPLWRRWYANAAGVAFTANELAQPFTSVGVLNARTKLFAIPESSCRFVLGDCATARAETGCYGNPCIAWVGHLNDGKDPLTVLDGIAVATAELPDLQLWCAFGNAPLLAQVQQRVAGDPRLAGRVHLLGKLPHARIERLMQAADLFVSGSHAESCGYALLEAVACGAFPVVTHIPSFRALTSEGAMGELWQPGDAAKLADALVRAAGNRPSREQVRRYFDDNLSFAAVGRKWAGAYTHVLGRSAP